jgi:ribosomal-protein-alanine N-acetyltransferase
MQGYGRLTCRYVACNRTTTVAKLDFGYAAVTVSLAVAHAGDVSAPCPALARGIAEGFAGGPDAGRRSVRDVLCAFDGADGSDPWVPYWTIDSELSAVVGMCGFKAAPTADGSVEIAYFTFPRFEGRGFAGAMVRALLDVAALHPVRCVVAHTLRVRNASTSVLERSGFRNAGTVIDPADGRVWRWVRDV